MQAESGFQKAFIKDFRELGFFVGAGSLSPGYPDVTAIRNNRVILTELKDASDFGPRQKVLDLFQRAQVPFYIRYLRKGTETINIVFKRKSEYYLLVLRKMDDVKILLNSDWTELVLKCAVFNSIKELVLFLSL
jgi:Holliday junction resolvase